MATFRERCDTVTARVREAFARHEQKRVLSRSHGDKRRLMNEAPTIRKLPPDAREQWKQMEESEKNGCLLCPTDEPENRNALVPLCAQVLKQSGTPPSLSACDGAGEDDVDLSELGVASTDDSKPEAEFVFPNDEDLVLLRPGDDTKSARNVEDTDEQLLRGTAQPKKKNPKARKERILFQLGEPERPTVAPPWNQGAAQQAGTAQISGHPGSLGGERGQPGGRSSGPGVGPVAVLPRGSNDGTRSAPVADSFAARATAGKGSARQSHGGSVSAGTVASPAQSTRSGSRSLAIPQRSTGTGGEFEPPIQPPPPRLPIGWRAVWCQEESEYYYWHVPTCQTSWDVPTCSEEKPAHSVTEGGQERNGHAEESHEVPAMFATVDVFAGELADITGCGITQARKLLAENNGSLELSIRAHALSVSGAAHITPAAETVVPNSLKHGEYVSRQHWHPPPEETTCIFLSHGERLSVSWTDGRPGGWAFGVSVTEPEKRGYCPQGALGPVPRLWKPLQPEDRLWAVEDYVPPPNVGGYLGLSLGDTVVVEFPVEEPCVWAYVSNLTSPLPVPSHGWVPLSVLDDLPGRGPHPAG